MTRVLLVLGALTLSAATAAAQAPAAYTPPPKGPSIGLRAYGLVDAGTMAATDSFGAVFGDPRMTAAGGGAEIDVWKHVFLRIAASRARRTGSRVFVDNGEVFDLNIPMTVTLTPVEAGGGWRFVTRSRFTPYAGGAFVSLGYRQVSDFAEPDENVNDRHTGAAVFGGVDAAIWKGIFIGGEAQYRRIIVPNVAGSVMHEFGEKDLGGFTARVRIGFSTK